MHILPLTVAGIIPLRTQKDATSTVEEASNDNVIKGTVEDGVDAALVRVN